MLVYYVDIGMESCDVVLEMSLHYGIIWLMSSFS